MWRNCSEEVLPIVVLVRGWVVHLGVELHVCVGWVSAGLSCVSQVARGVCIQVKRYASTNVRWSCILGVTYPGYSEPYSEVDDFSTLECVESGDGYMYGTVQIPALMALQPADPITGYKQT